MASKRRSRQLMEWEASYEQLKRKQGRRREVMSFLRTLVVLS